MSGPHSTVLPDTTYVTIPAVAGLDADSALPWLIDLDMFEQAVAHTNWDSIDVSLAHLLNAVKHSTGAQNAEINFDVPLAKGTWTVEVMYNGNTATGIITLSLDGTTIGTIDTYNAGAYNLLGSVSGVAVSQTGVKRLKLKMATKNASSSGYYVWINHIQLRRTA